MHRITLQKAQTGAILAVLLLSTFVTTLILVPAKGTEASTLFLDDFDKTQVDAERWVVQENTNMSGHPAYGGRTLTNNSYVEVSSNGSSFPCIYSSRNPFQTAEHFVLEFDFTYTKISDWGCGFWVTSGPPLIFTATGAPPTMLFQVWADNDGYDVVSIRVNLLDSLVWQSNIQGWEPSAPTHVFKLAYLNGTYTVYVDGNKVASTSSQVRPNMIGFGHPPAHNIPFSASHVASVMGGWCSFKIDCIKIQAASKSTNTDEPSSNLEDTQLSLSADSEILQIGYRVNLDGKLNIPNGNPISNAQVVLLYAISEIETWYPIALVTTDSQGYYSASWIPTATGKFTLKAEYLGNQMFEGSHDVKNISVLQSADENVFFAESNSTLSSISFNSTSNEITFSVRRFFRNYGLRAFYDFEESAVERLGFEIVS